MPIFDYKCEDCGSRYEVFHKIKEDSEIIVCPDCNSKSYKKLMSAASVGSSASSDLSSSCSAYQSGGCPGGMCGLN